MTTSEELQQLAESMRSINAAVRRIHPEMATPTIVTHLRTIAIKLTEDCERTARVLADLIDRMAQLEEELQHVRHYPRCPDSGGDSEG